MKENLGLVILIIGILLLLSAGLYLWGALFLHSNVFWRVVLVGATAVFIGMALVDDA